jgi:LacI family transcriptional regulator
MMLIGQVFIDEGMTAKKKHTTIRDIAKLANVSYQTVSLVINNRPGVSDKTRRR